MRIELHRLLLSISFVFFAVSAQAQLHQTDQIEVELISETSNVVPGETLWLGIRLDPIEHWHTYWKFGGDSGEATAASEWQLPAGAIAGDIVWPIPEWVPFPGTDLVSFAYKRDVLLPIPVTVPADYSGSSFDIKTRIDWQVCDEICIPGDAEFALSLPVGSNSLINEKWQQAFAETRANTPVPIGSHNLQANFNHFDGKFNVIQQRRVGDNHLKLMLSPLQAPQQTIDAIAFNIDEEHWPAPDMSHIEIAYRLDINEFRGNQSLQLMVEHILGWE